MTSLIPMQTLLRRATLQTRRLDATLLRLEEASGGMAENEPTPANQTRAMSVLVARSAVNEASDELAWAADPARPPITYAGPAGLPPA